MGWPRKGPPPQGEMMECSFEGCTTRKRAGGFCSGHYQQFKRGSKMTPIGQTVKKAQAGVADGFRLCWVCKFIKPLSTYSPNNYTCRSCSAELMLAKAAEIRQKVSEIKTTTGCSDCGYNKHPAALDFDHLPQYTKSKTVSALVGSCSPWSRIEAEIAKCEVVCANCHRVRTANRRKGE